TTPSDTPLPARRAWTPSAPADALGGRPSGRLPPAPLILAGDAMLLATYDLWGFVSENRHELWHGFVNTIKISAIAIVGSYAITNTLGGGTRARNAGVGAVA